MAYPIWQATITDDNGNVLPGAEITVVNEETGLNATLYSTRTGTSKSNPFFATVDGFAQFYAAPGLYRITATDGGTGTTQTFRYVRLVEVGTAAGEVMQVGAFGLGGTTDGGISQDWAVVGDAGKSAFVSSAVNGPLGATVVQGVKIRSGSGVATSFAGRQNRFFGQTVGFPWQEFYHTGNILGTVSQSSGVPTGAIIQRGSNANGEYVRFADGTMICHKRITFTTNASSQLGRVSPAVTWVFPTVFDGSITAEGSYGIFGNATNSGTSYFVTTRGACTTSRCDLVMYAVSESDSSRTLNIYAIGRWY